MKRFKVLGVNDDKDFCECCGKSGLKRVVWVEDTETGGIKHFGTSCAKSPIKGFDLQKEINSGIRAFQLKEQAQYIAARKLYRAEGGEFETILVPYTYKGKSGLSPESRPANSEKYQDCLARIKSR